jgi:hypothetical protein
LKEGRIYGLAISHVHRDLVLGELVCSLVRALEIEPSWEERFFVVVAHQLTHTHTTDGSNGSDGSGQPVDFAKVASDTAKLTTFESKTPSNPEVTQA